MGEKADESSSAAHGALDTEDPNQSGGFLSRLSTFFGTGEDDEDAGEHINGSAGPGLGNLRLMRLEDVAIPRVEITAVPVDISFDNLVEVFRESGNSRLPVYDGTLDVPIGMLHLKDLALKHGFNGDRDAEFDLRSLLRPLLYAPPSMPIGVLLQKMQTDRSHMALVIDEYGGVDGLVTIEDLIEQVIGEIADEHDTDDEALWAEEKPGCYVASARSPVVDFQEAIGLTFVDADEEEEIDTLGGLVFMMAGRVPARGEIIPHPSGAQFEVVDADARRIKRLRVRMPGLAQSLPRQAAE
ncbi:MAG: CBS domain-containing protein [Alphaproteobacteria bacterium]|jgi:magnesium and cobalt transporter|nr:CBS domain-containing protein [Alphaproteobacteria bacterium]